MIKMRLIRLLEGAGKYIVQQIVWQWISLLAQVVIVYNIAHLLENAWQQKLSTEGIALTIGDCSARTGLSLSLRPPVYKGELSCQCGCETNPPQ